jgi:DNA invertase Pin-like site-specific DNA recombinase
MSLHRFFGHGIIALEGRHKSIFIGTGAYMKMRRVAAYCRVSTDHEDQQNSLASQRLYFENLINKQDDWELTGLFADEGLTGTSLKRRVQFNNMVNLALRGKVDLILTKDVSRFARNTVDLLSVTRELAERGTGVLFLNDGIDTRSSEGELRLSIMAVFAQEESRKISERSKWGVAQAAGRGVVLGGGVYGYCLEKGVLTVNDAEAAVVRRIFREVSYNRKGIPTMARELNNNGTPCGRSKRWTTKKIKQMLKDERYIGDLVQRKTHVENYLTHKSVPSAPEEMIVVKNHHEAIVTPKMFEDAQCELQRRAALVGERSCHSNRYWASGLVKCGGCGSTAISRTKYNKDGSKTRFWTCKRVHNEKRRLSGCDSNLINDIALLECVRFAMREVDCNKTAIMNELKERIEKVQITAPSDAKRAKAKIDGLQKKIRRVIDLYVEESISKEEMRRQKQYYGNELAYWNSEIERVKRQQAETGNRRAGLTDTSAIMDKIDAVMKQKSPTPALYGNILEKVVLFNNRCVDVYFKHIDLPIRLRYRKFGRGASYRVECSLRQD